MARSHSQTNRLVGTLVAIAVSMALASGAIAQPRVVVNPAADALLPDRDPLLPDGFNPPRSRIFVIGDDPEFVRFLGRVRPEAVVEPRLKVQPQGVEVIDGRDADRDGYIEYFDGGAYVAELKKQGPLKGNADALRVTGIVRETHLATYEGQSEPHLLVRLEHDDGRYSLVDTGRAAALARLDLRPGDAVVVIARLGLVNDRPALIADELTHESTTVKIVRGRENR